MKIPNSNKNIYNLNCKSILNFFLLEIKELLIEENYILNLQLQMRKLNLTESFHN